jgi:NitT/TauT family transport system substrate-binding protein
VQTMQSRRHFLAGLSAAGAVGILGARTPLADEGPPETTTIRLPYNNNICIVPTNIAENLLHAEGFTDVQYVPISGGLTWPQEAGRGKIDIGVTFAATLAFQLDRGEPVTTLAGVHSGCYELFAHEPIRTIRDLKGKRVSIQTLSSSGHLYVSIMAAYVGLDPHKDIDWIVPSEGSAMELFAEGKVDAFLAFPPEPQELRARKVGHVILNTTMDKPWTEYFCCLLGGNRDFVQKYPIATRRVLRAILKATDLCDAEPERAARRLVEGGYTLNYEYAREALTEIPYAS